MQRPRIASLALTRTDGWRARRRLTCRRSGSRGRAPHALEKVPLAVGTGGAVATVDADATRVGLQVLGAATGVELLPGGVQLTAAEPTRRGGGSAGVVREVRPRPRGAAADTAPELVDAAAR